MQLSTSTASASSVLATADARGRDDDAARRIGLAARNGLVHRLAITHSVRSCGRNLALRPPEQRRHFAGVIGPIVGQHAGDDLASAGVHGEVQLAPGPPRPAVLLFVPLAPTEQFGAGAFDREIRGPVGNDDRLSPGEATPAAAKRCVVRVRSG